MICGFERCEEKRIGNVAKTVVCAIGWDRYGLQETVMKMRPSDAKQLDQRIVDTTNGDVESDEITSVKTFGENARLYPHLPNVAKKLLSDLPKQGGTKALGKPRFF